MRLSRLLPITLLLAGAAHAGVALEERPCDKRVKERAQAEWAYPLPPADSLPPLASYAHFGALILLDERVATDKGCRFTQVALVGDEQAAQRFANHEVFPQPGGAIIKGRVRYPDGTVSELRDEDLACGERRDYPMIRLGPPGNPRRMFVHFPRLTPGSLVQFQVFTGCTALAKEAWLQRPFSSLRGHHAFFHPWAGSGDAFSLLNGFETRHYPALSLRNTILGLKSAKPRWKIFPDDAPITTREYPTPSSSYFLTQFTASRPFIPDEPYAPPFNLRTPLLVVTYPDPSFDTTGWDALVNVLAAYGADSTPVEAARILKLDPLRGNETDPLSLARHFNRFFRDQPEGRRSEFGTFIGALKSRGIEVKRVWVRQTGQRPIDRSEASSGWFDDMLYAVEVAGRRHYFAPGAKVPSGALPIRDQGGEALVVTDRKRWEWVTLPAPEAPANGRRGDLALTVRDGSSATGPFTLTLSGSEAEGLRWLAYSSPAEINAAALRILSANAVEGLEFSALGVEGLSDPDAPIVIRALATLRGAVIRLGARSRLQPVRWRPGPKAEEFLAPARSSDIDFGWPVLGTLRVSFPAAWLEGALEPLGESARGPGITYTLAARREGDAVILERSFSWGGLHPASDMAVIRETLDRIGKSDDSGFRLNANAP